MFNKEQLFYHLIIDIETAPPYRSFDDMPDDWKRLWIEKISKTMPENLNPHESYRQRGGILAEFGKIICISSGYFFRDRESKIKFRIKSIYHQDERLVLEEFLQQLEAFKNYSGRLFFGGHNIREFDIPYLCRRMLVWGMQIPQCLDLSGVKPWEYTHTDTLQLWKFGDYKNYVSLHLLTHLLHVPTPKSDMDGSMVQDVYYKEKDLERIARYCQMDVLAVANILLRFSHLPLLSENDVEYASPSFLP